MVRRNARNGRIAASAPGSPFAHRRAHREEHRRRPDDAHQHRDDDAVDQVGDEPDPEARRLSLDRRPVREIGGRRAGRNRGGGDGRRARSHRRRCGRRHRRGPGRGGRRTRHRRRRRRRTAHRHGIRGRGRIVDRGGGPRRRRRWRGRGDGDRNGRRGSRGRRRLHRHTHPLHVQQGRPLGVVDALDLEQRLADPDLVPRLEAHLGDPLAVHPGPVRAVVVDQNVPVRLLHDPGVVPRDRVVFEDEAVFLASADQDLFPCERDRLVLQGRVRRFQDSQKSHRFRLAEVIGIFRDDEPELLKAKGRATRRRSESADAGPGPPPRAPRRAPVGASPFGRPGAIHGLASGRTAASSSSGSRRTGTGSPSLPRTPAPARSGSGRPAAGAGKLL